LEQVHQYLEDYERALQRFEAASICDPGLHAQHEVSKLVNLLSRLEDLTVNKGRIKPKRLATILSCLPPDICKLHLDIVRWILHAHNSDKSNLRLFRYSNNSTGYIRICATNLVTFSGLGS
jgi:hypothetical protein